MLALNKLFHHLNPKGLVTIPTNEYVVLKLLDSQFRENFSKIHSSIFSNDFFKKCHKMKLINFYSFSKSES